MAGEQYSRRRCPNRVSAMFLLILVLLMDYYTCREVKNVGIKSNNLNNPDDNEYAENAVVRTLSYEEVSTMRVRDIKRRIARSHGFSAEEVGRMIDKKELIEALAFEEEKLRVKEEKRVKSILVKRGIMTAIITILVIAFWPLIQHAIEVGHVNLVVYVDRKKFETSRCRELQSGMGLVGVVLMLVVDVLQVWLSLSLALSWVLPRNKYFFPVPQMAVRPAQLMGGKAAQSSVANYGFNIAPMAISWTLRFIHARIEGWTGRALVSAQKAQRRKERENETPEEKAARKEVKRAARKQAAMEREAMAEAMKNAQAPPPPPGWMEHVARRPNIVPTQPDIPVEESTNTTIPIPTDQQLSEHSQPILQEDSSLNQSTSQNLSSTLDHLD